LAVHRIRRKKKEREKGRVARSIATGGEAGAFGCLIPKLRENDGGELPALTKKGEGEKREEEIRPAQKGN